MKAYSYIAVAANGIENKGVIKSISELEAVRLLQQRQLVPIVIEELQESSEGLFSWWRINITDRTMLLRQLAMMTRSGITIPSAIPEIANHCYKTKVKRALNGIQSDLQAGIPLSTAMESHPQLFTPIVCGVIEASEQTGELSPAFERLADMLKFKHEIRKKLTMSFIYPAIVLVATVLVTYALFFNFIPKLSKFLQNLGKPLPPFTQKVFEFAAALRENVLIIIASVAALLLVLFIVNKTEKGRRILEKFFLRIPVFGKILVYSEVAMISSTLRAMMESGSSLITCLPLLAKSMSTRLFQDWIQGARMKLTQGISLDQCMDKKLIPSSARSVIKTGEQSGSLPEAFGELEGYYGNLLEHKINILVALINPALIIIIGTIVAVVYIAIILAIVSVNGT